MLAAALSLCSCLLLRDPGRVMVAEDVLFDLLPPSSFGRSLALTQSVTFSFSDEVHELLFYTEIFPERVVIVAVLPNGSRVFTLSHDGETLESDSYGGIVERIGAQYLLADFQLAQWPLETLQENLNHGKCFQNGDCSLSQSADGLHRVLSNRSGTALSISYSAQPSYSGTAGIVHHERGYSLQVVTLEVEEL